MGYGRISMQAGWIGRHIISFGIFGEYGYFGIIWSGAPCPI